MTTQNITTQLEKKLRISSLWIVLLFNMLFRDMHEFARPGFLEELLAMTSNGAKIPDALLLLSAIILQIPICMIFLTQALPMKINRWANMIGAALFMLNIIVMVKNPDLDDMFFMTIGFIAQILIIICASAWKASDPVGIYVKPTMA
jgi:hypothetical protein